MGRKEAREGGRGRQWMVVDQGANVVVVVWLLERHLCSRERIRREGDRKFFVAADSSWKWWWWSWVLAGEFVAGMRARRGRGGGEEKLQPKEEVERPCRAHVARLPFTSCLLSVCFCAVVLYAWDE